ncbi:MAG TPA: alpha/beta fold hydrolase [Kofleriaceae bacterium]|nr:alpha/beta fold hydrolase [Kofleriaceae bacterium]
MTATTSGYAPVNGIQLYYELHGSGEPLVVLHGGLGSIAAYGATIDALAQHRQVIAVDLYGHGHTGFVDGRGLSFEEMADDVGALIAHLGLAQADVMGYSLGALVAAQTAIRHRARVRRVVFVSNTFRRDGAFPEVVAALEQLGPHLADFMKPSPVYQHYARVAPRPDDFGKLIGETGALARRDRDWMSALPGFPPTLLVYGDADMVRPQHIVEIYAALGGGLRDPGWDGAAGRSASQLAILPGVNHYVMAQHPLLAATVERFLAGP